MKTIYKLSIAALMTLSSLGAFSQNAAFRFGVEAGLNLSNASVNVDPLDRGTRPGFQIGFTTDYSISDSWYIQSGLSFTTKGVDVEGSDKVAGSNESRNFKYTINESYLQVPVYMAYKIQVAPTTRIAFNVGPYVSYGVDGKVTPSDGYLNLGSGTEEINTFGGDGILDRFDLGAGAGAGIEFAKFQVTARYEWGLINVGQDEYRNFKNRNLAFTLGYKFY